MKPLLIKLPAAAMVAVYKASIPSDRRLIIIAAFVLGWTFLTNEAQPTIEVNTEAIHIHLFGPPPPDWIGSAESWGILPDPSGAPVENCSVCRSH